MSEQDEILVVDDNPVVVEIVEEILKTEGYRVRSANNGELALGLTATKPPQLILLDIDIPGIDGFEVCRRLQTQEETRKIPIIFISGLMIPEDKVKGFKFGGVDFISKPFQPEELLARVRTHLELSRLTTKLEVQVAEGAAQLHKLQESEERFRLITETIQEVFWMADIEKKRTFYISPGYEQVWGQSRKSLYDNPKSFLESIHPEDKARVLAELEVQKIGEPFDHEYRIIRPDGSIRWIWDRGFPVQPERGQVTWYVGVASDISDRKQMEEALRKIHNELEQRVAERTKELWQINEELQSKIAERKQVEETLRETSEKLQTIIQASPVAIIALSPDGYVKLWNPAAENLFGWRETEVIGQFLPYVSDDKREEHRSLRERVLRGEAFTGVEVRRQKKDGTAVDISISTAPMQDFNGNINGIMSLNIDITERKQAEAALRETEERYRTAIEQSNDGVCLVKGDRHIFVNQKMVEIFGYDRPEEIVGQPIDMIVHLDDLERVKKNNHSRQKGETVPSQYEFKGRRKNGEPVYIEASATKTTYQGEAVSLVYLRDITYRKKAEEALKIMSLTDDLTGLYNRRGFFTLSEQWLKTAQRMGTKMVLIFGDLDNMKKINDTLGHKEGDQALVDISQILKETFRESDIIARIGGDEFVILAMNSFETSAEKLINRFETILQDHPLQRERPYALSMSLGVACFDPKNPYSIDVLLAEADKLMYENKQKKERQG